MKRFLLILIGCLIPAISLAAYSDIPSGDRDEWAIMFLQQNGTIAGYADGSFRPENPVNRAELLKLLIRAKGGKQPTDDPSRYRDCFPDVHEEWFAPYVCYALQRQWVSGYPDGLFHPERSVNTAEAAKLITKVWEMFVPDDLSTRYPSGLFFGYDITSWFVPYLNALWQYDLIYPAFFSPSLGTAVSPVDAPLKRRYAAELLYKVLLAWKSLSPNFKGQYHTDCSLLNVASVRLEEAVPDFAEQALEVVHADGSSCVLLANVNPYARVYPNLMHFLRLQDPPLSSTNNIVHFRAEKDGMGGNDLNIRWDFYLEDGGLRLAPFLFP